MSNTPRHLEISEDSHCTRLILWLQGVLVHKHWNSRSANGYSFTFNEKELLYILAALLTFTYDEARTQAMRIWPHVSWVGKKRQTWRRTSIDLECRVKYQRCTDSRHSSHWSLQQGASQARESSYLRSSRWEWRRNVQKSLVHSEKHGKKQTDCWVGSSRRWRNFRGCHL